MLLFYKWIFGILVVLCMGAISLPLSAQENGTVPYTEQDIRFENIEQNITLAGTLTLPAGDGPFPVVITISGSGPQDRDESLGPNIALKPFALIADALAREGIAVLRYDDRGVGGSTGYYNRASTLDLATDARAAVDYVLTRDEIDPSAIGLLGHSEGGLIAPVVAAQCEDVAFVISLAGPGVNGAEVLRLQLARIMALRGYSEETQAKDLALLDQIVAASVSGDSDQARSLLLKMSTPLQGDIEHWFPVFFSLEPSDYWTQVTVPVLVILAENDMRVAPEQSLPPLKQALNTNSDATIIVIADANHLFQFVDGDNPIAYRFLGDTFHPDLLPTIIEWVRVRFR